MPATVSGTACRAGRLVVLGSRRIADGLRHGLRVRVTPSRRVTVIASSATGAARGSVVLQRTG